MDASAIEQMGSMEDMEDDSGSFASGEEGGHQDLGDEEGHDFGDEEGAQALHAHAQSVAWPAVCWVVRCGRWFLVPHRLFFTRLSAALAPRVC